VADADACDPSQPFDPPRAITELDTPVDESTLRLSPDYLTAYFSSDRSDAGNYDLFTTNRVAANNNFGAPSLLPLVNTPSAEFDPSMTDKNTTLYFASDRPKNVGGFDVYVATRPNLVSEFANAAPVANVNNPTF